MLAPVADDISQDYGANPTRGNPHPIFGDYQPDGHTGRDYRCKAGTPVRAVTDGTVLHVGWYRGSYLDNAFWINPGFAGWTYTVRHRAWWGTFIGIYGHCMEDAARVTVGQEVTEGQVLGLSGNTGASTGDHLHFEAMYEPVHVNSHMYGRFNPATLFGGLSYAGTTTAVLEEIDVSAEQNILARLNQVLLRQDESVAWIDGRVNQLAGFVRDVVNAKGSITAAELDAKLAAFAEAAKPSGQTMFKSDQSPEVYVWDGAAGFRHIQPDEYLSLITAGAVLREIEGFVVPDAARADQ